MFGRLKLFSLLTVLALTAFVGCGGGGGSSSGGQQGSSQAIVTGPPQEPELDPADVILNLTRLEWGPGDYSFGDLYRPDHISGPIPVVVMIHGGCWLSAYNLTLQASLSEAIARRGFAVWNIEYRRLGNGGEWPVIFWDVSLATNFLTTIAEEYNLDLDRVSAMGHSSGGHLALWLASRHKLTNNSLVYERNPIPIRGVVGLGAITDLESSICSSSVPRLIDLAVLNEAETSQRLAETSPRAMLPIGIASILISGSDDTIAPADNVQAYVDDAVRSGDFTEHLIIEGADHFDLINSDFMDLNLLMNSLQLVQSRTGSR